MIEPAHRHHGAYYRLDNLLIRYDASYGFYHEMADGTGRTYPERRDIEGIPLSAKVVEAFTGWVLQENGFTGAKSAYINLDDHHMLFLTVLDGDLFGASIEVGTDTLRLDHVNTVHQLQALCSALGHALVVDVEKLKEAIK